MSLDANRILTATKTAFEAANPGVTLNISIPRNILLYLIPAIVNEITTNGRVIDGQTVTGDIVIPGPSGGTYSLQNGKTTTKGNLE
jgi:hypothetical protein